MVENEVPVLRQVLSAHRAMVEGALQTGAHVDIDGAFRVHAGISRILARWDDFSAAEQREIVRTIQYVVDPDDDEPDLTSPEGFQDDLAELHRLQALLGYV